MDSDTKCALISVIQTTSVIRALGQKPSLCKLAVTLASPNSIQTSLKLVQQKSKAKFKVSFLFHFKKLSSNLVPSLHTGLVRNVGVIYITN